MKQQDESLPLYSMNYKAAFDESTWWWLCFENLGTPWS